MSDSSEVATVAERTAQIEQFRGLYDPSLDFAKLALEAKYFAQGYRLLGGDKYAKDALLSIPFIILGVTYREGYLNDKIQGDYISCEGIVANAQTLSMPQVQLAMGDRPLAVYPNEPIVFNDGGTGIRRTLTKLFHQMGLINVGGNPERDGDRVFDRPYSLWEDGADYAMSGIVADHHGEPFRYLAPRGLRRSDYDSDFGPATTYYFG